MQPEFRGRNNFYSFVSFVVLCVLCDPLKFRMKMDHKEHKGHNDFTRSIRLNEFLSFSFYLLPGLIACSDFNIRKCT